MKRAQDRLVDDESAKLTSVNKIFSFPTNDKNAGQAFVYQGLSDFLLIFGASSNKGHRTNPLKCGFAADLQCLHHSRVLGSDESSVFAFI